MPVLTANGTIFGRNATIGTKDWSTYAQVETSDNGYCTLAYTGVNEISYYISIRAYDFSSLPDTSIIDGWLWKVEGQNSYFVDGDVVDWSVRMMKDGTTPIGDDKATQTPLSENTDATVEYGGASDLWGVSWDLSDLTGGVGLLYSTKCTSFPDTQTAKIDHIQMNLYFIYVYFVPSGWHCKHKVLIYA